MLLGHYPDCSHADARLAYNDAYKLLKKGIDPRDQKKAIAEENATTVEQLAGV
ncbi:MAG: integrase arm-type DNA-binding domain-containing protein [Desulfuromonadaceae bacterium]